MFQSKRQASPVGPFCVTAPVWRVPSSSQPIVAGLDDVVTSQVTALTSVVTTNGAV